MKLLALATFALLVLAQTPESQRAAQLFQTQDFAGAAQAYAAIAEKEPNNATAWHRLGYSLHALERYDEAVRAHEKAASFPATASHGAYNAACAYALLGKTDDAFTWLDRATAAGFNNTNLLSTDTDLSSLRSDPRFAKFVPDGRDATQVFREPTRVLLDLLGEAGGDNFGWIARNAGDMDGDGVEDFVTSAPYKYIGGAMAGRVYAFSSKSGKRLFSRDGKPGDYLGAGIEAAGDANGDGTPDLLAGAPRWRGGAGEAYVLSGRDGAELLKVTAGEEGDRFGHHVMGVGDVNGDGCSDLLIGAPRADTEAGADAGKAYLYSGRDGKQIAAWDGERAGDQFGSTVGGRDGLLLIGAPNAGDGQRGRMYVYRAKGGKVEHAFDVASDENDKNLGQMFVSVVGDVNGDGAADVYSSDWDCMNSRGRIYVHSGKDGSLLHDLKGEQAGDGFGIGTCEAGDVDGDGCDDLVVGAWQHASAAPSGGKGYLYSGRSGELMRTWTCKLAGETFGFDATGIGDVDGDGAIDFLFTSAESSVAGPKAGRVLILAGEPKK